MKFRPQIKILFLLLLACIAMSCTSDRDPELEKKYKIGGLYSVTSADAGFNVVKIIALTKGIVHIRLYKNTFQTRPDTVDPATLSLGGIDDPEGFGIGHLPMDKDVFEKMQPIFIKQESVSDEELEGFKFWKKETGGFFN
jgi:hypothetical protein